MTRLLLALTIGLLIAAAVAWQLGGTLGGGVIAGYLLGGGIGGLGVLWQKHVLETQPKNAMSAVAVSFGAKLLVLAMGGLAFRYIDAAAERADWRSFLITFAAAVALITPVGATDAVKALILRSGPKESPVEPAG